jgi:hypothetical protein
MDEEQLGNLTAPVEPVLFMEMSAVYQDAAQVPFPTPTRTPKGPHLQLTDIPVNRGMLAVVAALREKGEPDAIVQSVMSRLMNFGDILSQPDYFVEFLRPVDGEPGAMMIEDVLIMAAGTARLARRDDNRLVFDLEDVLEHARRFKAEE